MSHLTQAINQIEAHVLSVAGKWRPYQRLQEPCRASARFWA